jgi:hypothetical protein
VKKIMIVTAAFITFLILSVGVFVVQEASWFASQTTEVVKQEVDPKELLRKYSWLKEAMASLDSKKATLDANASKIKAMEVGYKGVPRNQWSEMDAVQYNQWLTEQDGLKASYNNLAAEYNAKMAEVHWAFTNVGNLPHGESQILPREYRDYITN